MSVKISNRSGKQAIEKYTDVLQFGKYKGKTVEWLLNNDADYILWLDENGWTILEQIVRDAEEIDSDNHRDGFYYGEDIYYWMDEPF